MKIDVNDKYFIQSDPDQMMVIQRGVVTKADSKRLGEETNRTLGYFKTLQQCFTFLLQYQIRASGANGFKEVMEEVERIEKELKEAIKI